MKKLFTLKLIYQNPRKFVSHTTKSNLTHKPTNLFQKPYHNTTSIQVFKENKLLLKRFLPNALLKFKATNKLFLDHGNFGSLRAQFRRHNFHYDQTVGFQKFWLSYFRRRLTTDGVVLGLIVTNVAVFVLWRVADLNFMKRNFMIQLDTFKSGRFHTMITSAFSQIEPGHIVSNMIGLLFFGTGIGRRFGPEFLLKLYLVGAFVGSAFFLIHHAFMATSSKNKQIFGRAPSKVSGLGASGAVNAIMLLYIFLNPRKTIYVEFVIPVPAILLGIFLVSKDMLRIIEGNSQISGSAHLGGAAVAVIAWARLRRRRF